MKYFTEGQQGGIPEVTDSVPCSPISWAHPRSQFPHSPAPQAPPGLRRGHPSQECAPRRIWGPLPAASTPEGLTELGQDQRPRCCALSAPGVCADGAHPPALVGRPQCRGMETPPSKCSLSAAKGEPPLLHSKGRVRRAAGRGEQSGKKGVLESRRGRPASAAVHTCAHARGHRTLRPAEGRDSPCVTGEVSGLTQARCG